MAHRNPLDAAAAGALLRPLPPFPPSGPGGLRPRAVGAWRLAGRVLPRDGWLASCRRRSRRSVRPTQGTGRRGVRSDRFERFFIFVVVEEGGG